MTPPEPTDDDLILLDRWIVPLGEPPAPPPPAEQPEPELFRFPAEFDAIPEDGYQPRLTRFGKAG